MEIQKSQFQAVVLDSNGKWSVQRKESENNERSKSNNSDGFTVDFILVFY